jgi:hypothetical protein
MQSVPKNIIGNMCILWYVCPLIDDVDAPSTSPARQGRRGAQRQAVSAGRGKALMHMEALDEVRARQETHADVGKIQRLCSY